VYNKDRTQNYNTYTILHVTYFFTQIIAKLSNQLKSELKHDQYETAEINFKHLKFGLLRFFVLGF